MDEIAQFDARLRVVEIMLADTWARMAPDARTLRVWSNRLADAVEASVTKHEGEAPEIFMEYTAAWDAMLAKVRLAHEILQRERDAGGGAARR